MPRPPADHPLLVDLNGPQREAVTHVDGALLVLAGPGSGKTRVITRRAAYLVRVAGAQPREVLCITFTNRAAREMLERIAALGVAHGMWVCTFHALAVRLMREHPEAVGLQPGFTILDESDQRSALREAMRACGVSDTLEAPEALQARIGDFKDDLWTPADAQRLALDHRAQTAARVYAHYQPILAAQNAVDFDDLLMKLACLLRDDPECRARLNARFRYVLVDEYQDTNHAQYTIARLLSTGHGNLCVTGDPDQSIYAWRGANIRNILEFEQGFPAAKVVRLEENYRSTGHILRAADGLISANIQRPQKTLWTRNAEGSPVEIRTLGSDLEEAEFVAERIAALIAQGDPPAGTAIFYRTNAISRPIEEALRRQGIPYRVARGAEFYARREIKDTVAYLRVLVNPLDQTALERIVNVPARGIGKATLQRLQVAAQERGCPLGSLLTRAAEIPGLKAAAPRLAKFGGLLEHLRRLRSAGVAALVNDVIRLSGMEEALRQEREEGGEDRLANLLQLVNAATEYESRSDEPSLEEFVQQCTLTSDQDSIDPGAGAVTLMTLHTAKGLEFPNVFIIGCEQGLLPHERSLRSREPQDVEEERRLCFVGITRARRRLWLTWATQRMVRGRVTVQSSSQFLQELPEESVIWAREEERRPREDAWATDTEQAEAEDELRPRSLRHARASDAPSGRAAPRARSSRRRTHGDDEPVYTRDDPTLPPAYSPPPSPYDAWSEGDRVLHPRYGEGTLLWIRRSFGRTIAAVRFEGQADQVFILEQAPVTRPPRA